MQVTVNHGRRGIRHEPEFDRVREKVRECLHRAKHAEQPTLHRYFGAPLEGQKHQMAATLELCLGWMRRNSYTNVTRGCYCFRFKDGCDKTKKTCHRWLLFLEVSTEDAASLEATSLLI